MNPWDMSERAYEISSARRDWWEYALFAQAVCDVIDLQRASVARMLVNENNLRSVFHLDCGADVRMFIAWINGKLQRLPESVSAFSGLLAVRNEDAFGVPGEAGDPEKITALATRVGAFYREAVTFSSEIQAFDWVLTEPVFGSAAVILDATFRKVREDFIAAAAANIQFFEDYGPEILRRIDEAASRKLRGEPAGLDLFIKFKVKFDEDGDIARATALIDSINADLEVETLRLRRETKDIESFLRRRPDQGYLYLLLNLSMPELVKIGKTTRTPKERGRELSAATGVPTPFVVAYEMFVDDCHRAEKRIHELLEPQRVSENREFFRMSVSDAVNAMLEVKRLVQQG